MNKIKIFSCLIVILFACPAASEIYKFVDEDGHIHFTDDFGSLPFDQRDAFAVDEAYETDTDNEPADAKKASAEYEMDSNGDFAEDYSELSDGSEDREDEDPQGLEEVDQNADLEQSLAEEQEHFSFSDEIEAEENLDVVRQQLDITKKQIDGEYQTLLKQKEQLTKAAESLKGREAILEHNRKVEHLNDQAERYAKRVKNFETRLETYNQRITNNSARAQNSAEHN